MRCKTIFSVLLTTAAFFACTGDDPVAVGPAVDVGDGGNVGDGASSSSSDGGTEAGGDAAVACPKGLADCKGNGVCDVAVESDPENCGVCGRSCGAACNGGACVAKELANNLTNPQAIAVNTTSVAWVRDGALESCPKTGCGGAATTLGNKFVLYSGGPRKMFSTENQIFWIGRGETAGTTEGKVFRCDVTGCPQNQPGVFDEASRGGQLVANSTTMFRWEPIASLYVRPIDGSSAAVTNSFAYDESNFTYAADDTALVWSNMNTGTDAIRGVYACGLPCTKAATRILAAGRHVAVRSGKVYASRDDSSSNPTASEVVSCAVTGCGGSGTNLTPEKEGVIVDIVADDTSVYWLVRGSLGSPTGSVRACALPDCKGGPRTLAGTQAAPVAMAQDADFVYWANRGTGGANTGAIQRVRK